MIDLPIETLRDLLNRIAQKDDQAATQLYRHYHGFLYAYTRHQLPDDAAADEVTQDVFLFVFQKPHAFGEQSKFSTWLCSIAWRKAADWGRKRKREIPLADVPDEVMEAAPDPNWDFVARIESAQDAQALRYCIDRLPGDQREAVFSVYYDDAGLEQVARQQGCPVGTVKSRLSTARRRLGECISRWIKGGRHD